MKLPSQRKDTMSTIGHTKQIWRHYTGGFIFISIAGVLGGGALLVSTDAFLQYSNTTEFCISCHEMKTTVFEEYTQTIHYNNRTGIRVGCSDCHVPNTGLAMITRKIGAAKDIYGHLTGIIDTPEKFEAKRLEMAETVWQYMSESNSRECRSCHDFEAMDFKEQRRRPRKKHPQAMRDGKTCIDCHKGIAHELPADFDLADDD